MKDKYREKIAKFFYLPTLVNWKYNLFSLALCWNHFFLDILFTLKYSATGKSQFVVSIRTENFSPHNLHSSTTCHIFQYWHLTNWSSHIILVTASISSIHTMMLLNKSILPEWPDQLFQLNAWYLNVHNVDKNMVIREHIIPAIKGVDPNTFRQLPVPAGQLTIPSGQLPEPSGSSQYPQGSSLYLQAAPSTHRAAHNTFRQLPVPSRQLQVYSRQLPIP